MNKLCFGTYTTILKHCKVHSISQKVLCGKLLLSIAPNYDIREMDITASELILGKKNLSQDVTESALEVNAHETSNYFKLNVVPMLDPNKHGLIVEAIKNVIASDDTIKPNTVVEKVNNISKAALTQLKAFVLADFLAGIFLYTALNVENRHCEKYVKAMTPEYLMSFENQASVISFVSSYSAFTNETAKEVHAGTRHLVLLSTTGGRCQKCGQFLYPNIKGIDVDYAKIFHLSETEETILCVTCEREMQNASADDKIQLFNEKQHLDCLLEARNATSRYQMEKQIEELLCVVQFIELDNTTQLRMTPTKVENKITEKRLKERVLYNVVEMYDTVNSTLDRLAGENHLNVDKFARDIKRMYEDVRESLRSQSDIYNVMVDSLFEKTGRKYREACEIVISYFVQRCEVFDEIAE